MLKQFKIELYKVYKKPIFLLFLLMPIVITLFNLFNLDGLNKRLDLYQDFFNEDFSSSFYRKMCQDLSIYNHIVIFILGYNYARMEIKNRCFNGLFTLPQKRITLYSAKVFVLFLYALANAAVSYLILLAISLAHPEIDTAQVSIFLSYFLAFSFMLLFQFMLANLTNNFVLYSLIFILLFSITILIKHEAVKYTPYSVYNLVTYKNEWINNIIAIIYLVMSYLFGFLIFKRLPYVMSKRD